MCMYMFADFEISTEYMFGDLEIGNVCTMFKENEAAYFVECILV